jgi:hypothetical protein
VVKTKLIWFAGLAITILSGCRDRDDGTVAFTNEKLSCPAPAMSEFQPWGRSGMQHVCKITHGQFVAFEDGYVKVGGQYDNGKEVGTWYWYDSAGRIVKQIDYATSRSK